MTDSLLLHGLIHTFVTKIGLRIDGLKNRQGPRVTVRIRYEVVDGKVEDVQTDICFAQHQPNWYPCIDFWDLIDLEQYEELNKLMLQHAREPIEDFQEESHVARG